MSALPLTALRPLAFPAHGWLALVCLRTGRVLALLPHDGAVSRQTIGSPDKSVSPTALSDGSRQRHPAVATA